MESPEALLCQAQRQNPLPDLSPAGAEPARPAGVSAAAETGAAGTAPGDNRGLRAGQGPRPPPHGREQRKAVPGAGTPVPCDDAVPVPGRCRPPLSAPKAPLGSPARRPAGGGRHCPAAGSVFLPSLRPRRGGGQRCWHPHPRTAETAPVRPGAVTAPLRPQAPRPEERAGRAGTTPGPAAAHKGEARNRARTRRVGGLEPPRGGSGGGAAVTAGLCPEILKKPPVFSPPFPAQRARQPRPGCRAGWGRVQRPSSLGAPSAQPGRKAGRGPEPAALQPRSATARGSALLPAPSPAIAAGMGCFCAVPEEFYCEVLLLDESKLTLTTQQQGIKVRTAAGLRNAMRERTRGAASGWLR